ncbi:MAG: hypothetical protein AAF378_12645 [Cyanobacteria bacterium P01_A01_bin.84]
MSKRFLSLTAMLAVSTVNVVSILPAFGEGIDNNTSNDTALEGFERPKNAKIVNTPLKQEPVPVTKINESQVQVIKKAPIQFKAFELKDPQTSKIVAPDKVLTLPNGKKVRAKEYYAELNRLEQQFNKLGYSLRQPEEKVTLQTSVLKNSELQKQSEEFKKSEDVDARNAEKIKQELDPQKVLRSIKQQPTTPKNEIITPGTETPESKINPEVNPGELNKQFKPSAPQATSGTGQYIKTWNKSVGSNSTFSAYINGKLELKGTTTSSKAFAEGKAGGYMFNRHAQLLRARADLNAPTTGNMTTSLNLSVVGRNVYSVQDSRPSTLTKADTYSRSLDKQVANIRFSLGPIPMRARFGVQGRAGFGYYVVASASQRKAYAKLTPFIDSRAYGQGGADIVVGGAGVGTNLLLLKDNLDVRGQARVGFASGNRAYLNAYYYGYNRLEALSGNAYAYAYIYVPKFGIPPYKKKQWNWNIWNWSGLKHQGYLFSGNKKVYF